METQLFTKITRAAIGELAENINAPKLAKTFNYAKGIGPKGNFEIYTYFDDFGNIIKRQSDYFLEGNHTSYVTKYTKIGSKKYEFLNGRAQSITKTDLRCGAPKNNLFNNGRYLFSEATTYRDSLEDLLKLTFLKKGEKPQSMEFKTSWNSTAPEIKYNNMDGIFDGENYTEYLPPLFDMKSLRRFEHIYKYQMKEQGIDDVFDTFHLIRSQDLPNHFEGAKAVDDAIGIAAAFNEKTGDVFYVTNKECSVADEIEAIAHEVQHARDYIDVTRLKDTLKNEENKLYYEKARKKGLITKSKHKKDYNRLVKLRETLLDAASYNDECLKGNHDDLAIEGPAIMKGLEESENISQVWRKIMVYFGFWNG